MNAMSRAQYLVPWPNERRLVMKRVILGLVFACAALLSGCNEHGYKEAEAIMEEVLECYSDLRVAFAGVQSPSSARTAAPRINAICDRLEQLSERADKVVFGKRGQKKIEAKYYQKFDELYDKVQETAERADENAGDEPTFARARARLDRVESRMVFLGLD